MFAKATSVAVVGMDGYPVDVEVQVAKGLPAFTVVGLPDTAIQESRERVRAAIQASGEEWPNRRLTVNLSPAHLPKTGSGFDLAIALGVLAAVGRVPAERLRSVCVIGELSLDGRVRKVRGALAAVGAAAGQGARRVLVPRANAPEATLIDGVDVIPLAALAEAVRFLRGECKIDPATRTTGGVVVPAEDDDADFAEVRGHLIAKRAMEIAAAGGHHVIMRGPPGVGKTMLARRLPTILPPLERDEAMAVTRLYSVAGLLPDEAGLITRRPFRAPHHSISLGGLVGGGSGIPLPGEVSLAHRGVLFLDEASEFRRDALQALRQPIEDGRITISRARFSVTYPSRCQLVLATNPCPCGHLNDPVRPCECIPGRVTAYKERLSGPLLDRIDLFVDVVRISKMDIFSGPEAQDSSTIRTRVLAARERQGSRLARFRLAANGDIPARALESACELTPDAKAEVERSQSLFGLSMRGAHRLIRVSRTVADLEGSSRVEQKHVEDATRFRFAP